MTRPTDIADKLDEARALIERGWCQKTYDANGCVCILGAISKVANGDARIGGIGKAKPLHDVLKRALKVKFLWQWNDHPERTQAEVIEAFRKAAELARAEAGL